MVQNISSNHSMKKTLKQCPRCKATFECMHSKGCWCSKYSLTEELNSYLKENYKDCLCENCLKELSNS